MPRESHPTTDRSGSDPTRHPCSQCGRSFARKEHLQRHLRTHTLDYPYPCSRCQQRFKRQDVYARHIKSFCRFRPQATPQSTRVNDRSRTTKACERCRLLKVKCNGALPCSRCSQRHDNCTYAADKPGTTSLLNGLGQREQELYQVPGSAADAVSPDDVRSDAQDPQTAAQNTSFEDTLEPDLVVEALPSFRPTMSGVMNSGHSVTSIETSNDMASSMMRTPNHQPSAESVWGPVASLSNDPFFSDGVDGFSLIDQWPAAVQSNDIPLDPWLQPNEYSDPFLFDWDARGFLDEDLIRSFTGDRADIPRVQDKSRTTDDSRPLADKFVDASASTEHAPQNSSIPSWLAGLRPSISHFDNDIVNYCLHKFLVNMNGAFPTFEDFEFTAFTLPDVVLAMAAVGALFSRIEGSSQIASSMYMESRRLVLGKAYCETVVEKGQEINVVQTYICLELFGLCSGDARCFECSEAFHRQLLAVAQEYGLLYSSSSASEEFADAKWRLLNSLYLLESYRVVLLQRPPNLYPIHDGIVKNLPESIELPSSHRASDRQLYDSISLLRVLLSPHKLFRESFKDLDANFCLTSLAALSWHTRTQTLSAISFSPLWKRENVELALHRWMQEMSVRRANLAPWMTLLFHLTFINLYAPLQHIHSLTRAQVSGKGRKGDVFDSLSAWRKGEDAEKAMFHADSIIQFAKSVTVYKRPNNSSEMNAFDSRQPDLVEGPHMAMSVYIASLTLWAAAVCQQPPDKQLRRSSIESGIQLLWWLNVRAARMLGNVLRHIGLESRAGSEEQQAR